MKILHRYILTQFLKGFVIFFISLTGLYIIIDAFGNLEEFITYGQQQGGFFAVLADYYSARAVAFFDLTCGVLCLISAMFTIAMLQRQNELTALMAAGVSKWQVVAPMVGMVVVLSLLAALNRETLLPKFRDKLSRNAQNWLGENARPLKPRYDNETEIFIGGKSTLAAEEKIERPRFRLPPELEHLGTQIAAESAYYRPPSAEHPGGYLFEQVSLPESIAELPSASFDGKPVVLMPLDQPWLKHNQCFVASQVDFEQLEGGSAWRQYSSTMSLIHAIGNPALGFGPDVRLTIHSRLVQPLLDVTLLLLGLPLVLTRENRNVFVAIGMCILVVFAYFVLVLACHSMGNNYLLSPAFAAWCPLIIFAPVAAWLFEGFRR